MLVANATEHSHVSKALAQNASGEIGESGGFRYAVSHAPMLRHPIASVLYMNGHETYVRLDSMPTSLCEFSATNTSRPVDHFPIETESWSDENRTESAPAGLVFSIST